MKYLKTTLEPVEQGDPVDALVEADGKTIRVTVPGQSAEIVIAGGDLVVGFMEIVPAEPPPPPKPRGVKRHSRKNKEAEHELPVEPAAGDIEPD